MFRKLAESKVVIAVRPGAIVDNAAFTGQAIDTLGYSECFIAVILGALDIAAAALKVTECETSGGTYTDVTGLIYGTSTNIAGSTSALPIDTEDNKVYGFDIDLRGRKRYLKLAATGGDGSTGTYLTALAILSRGNDAPNTAAERGCADILRI